MTVSSRFQTWVGHDPDRSEPDRPWNAFFWMFLSGLCFSTMAIFVKNLSGDIPQYELIFFRSFVNLVLLIPVLWWSGVSLNVPNKPLLVFRGLMGFGGLSCFFWAITHLPLSVAAILNWCAPLFVLLFSRLLLKEKVSGKVLFWIALAFVGMAFITDPNLQTGEMALPVLGVGMGLLGAAFAAMAYVAVRAAALKVGVNVIVFYFTLTASILSFPFAMMDFVWPNLPQFFQLVAMGSLAAGAQFSMTQGYRHAKAGVVSAMGLMNAIFSALWGWMIFSEKLSLIQWIGASILALSVLMVALRSKGQPVTIR